MVAERVNSESVLAVSRCLYAPLLRARGDLNATESLLTQALRYFEQGMLPDQSGPVLVELAELRRQQGRAADAMQLLEQAGPVPGCHLVHAELALDERDWDTAAEHAAAYLRQSAASDHLARSAALVVLACAHANAGRQPQARAAAAAAAKIAATAGTPAIAAAALAAAGAARVAAGDQGAAAELLAVAVDAYRRAALPVETARTRLQLAEVLAALGRDTDAQAQRRTASHALARLRAGAARGHLTARERQIARMIAAGLADGAIARRLKISEHTVHRHVANLRARLGAATRAAAVARAQELDLL